MPIDRNKKLEVGRLFLSDGPEQKIDIFEGIASNLLTLLLEGLVYLFDVVVELGIRADLLKLMVYLLQLNIEDPVGVLQMH